MSATLNLIEIEHEGKHAFILLCSVALNFRQMFNSTLFDFFFQKQGLYFHLKNSQKSLLNFKY